MCQKYIILVPNQSKMRIRSKNHNKKKCQNIRSLFNSVVCMTTTCFYTDLNMFWHTIQSDSYIIPLELYTKFFPVQVSIVQHFPHSLLIISGLSMTKYFRWGSDLVIMLARVEE